MIQYERLAVLKGIHHGNEITITQVGASSWHIEIRNPMSGVYVTLANDEAEAVSVVEAYFKGE